MSFRFLRNKTSFFFVFFYPPFVIFFFGETALSIDPFFNACEPYSCGEGPNISYPFYVSGIQPSYCGFPGFNLVCSDRKPLLQISQNELYLTKIFPENQSVSLVSKNFPRDNCPRDIKNLTLSRTPFSYEPTKLNLTFFFNCNGSFPDGIRNYQIRCMSNGTHRSYATLYGKQVVGLKCETAAEAPAGVLAEGDVEGYLRRNDYLGMFKKGFLFKWTASNCSDCERSGGRCGFNSSEFLCFCHDRPHKVKCQGSRVAGSKKIKRKVVIGVSAGAVGSVVGGFFFCFLYFYCRGKCSSTASSTSGPRNFSSKGDLEKCYSNQYATHIFPYKELEEATNNFDSSGELGDGGFGTVYYGKLRDGRSVAVKRLYDNNYKRVKQFINEVKILSGLRHQNLVSLYGCTSRHSHELLLVYEFIPNGTVADHLHGDRAKPGALTWPIRMKIAIETAEALAYLHAVEPPIIHRDVKTNNILLDDDFHVKVADFGLSRLFPTDATHVSTTPQGTPGYVDPDYHKCYQLTDRSDVYSFGVVLMELISSKPAVDISRHRYEINLATMAINKIHNRALHELVDSSLGYESDCTVRKMIILVSELAFRCLQEEKEGRPSMDEVVEELSRISREEYRVEKKMTKVPDNSTDEVGLLKNIPPPSPDTVMGTWVSKSSTASINS